MMNSSQIASLICCGAIAQLAGCASETGNEYTGEVLMKLEGKVEVTDAVPTDTVPALVVYPAGETSAGLASSARFLIDGSTSGSFPSRFTFEVTRPPPEAAIGTRMHATEFSQNNSGAVGYLAMVPRDHPETLPISPLTLKSRDGTCPSSELDQPCATEKTWCNASNECVTLHFDCVVAECPIVTSSGDPSLLNDQAPGLVTVGAAKGSPAMVANYTLIYDESDPSRNYQEVRVCDRSDTNYGNWGADEFGDELAIQCTLARETGAVTIDDEFALYDVAATNTVVVYSIEAAFPGWDLLPVESGYNVFQRLAQTPEEFAAVLQCREAAWFKATVEYNEANGTSYEPHGISDNMNGSAEIIAHVIALQADCPPLWKKVSSGDEVALTIGPLSAAQ